MCNLSSLVEAMRTCEQAPGLSVLQHGLMVRDRYSELVAHLRGLTPLKHEWRLPNWIGNPILLERLPPDETMARYHVFHVRINCGKPTVLTIVDGRRHFPGHATASELAYLASGGEPDIAALIGMDMDIHFLKDVGVAAFALRPQACGLLLTGLAEVHANASMFGGIGSDSFKAKWKTLDRRGKAILVAIERATHLSDVGASNASHVSRPTLMQH